MQVELDFVVEGVVGYSSSDRDCLDQLVDESVG